MISKKILVVDDDRVVAETIAAVLRLAGYTVATATTAPAAISLLLESCPDLLLVEYEMPYGAGDVFLNALHGRFPDLPIVVTSHSCLSLDQMPDVKADGLYSKGCSGPVELLNTVAGIIGRSLPASSPKAKSAGVGMPFRRAC